MWCSFSLSSDPLLKMPFCHALCIYANIGLGNGLLERAPVVASLKIYETGEMKRMELSFSRRTAVWSSGDALVLVQWMTTDNWEWNHKPTVYAGIWRVVSLVYVYKFIPLCTSDIQIRS